MSVIHGREDEAFGEEDPVFFFPLISFFFLPGKGQVALIPLFSSQLYEFSDAIFIKTKSWL